MKEVFEKIIEFIHSEIERTTSYAEHDTLINVKFFVEGLAEEHKQQLSNDLEIISSLPSLYPLQPFEEEAIHRVVESVNNNGWIPVSSGMFPEEHDSIFARYKGTDKWNTAMFEKISDEVNVTVVDEKGRGATTHAHTIDGKWSCDLLKANKTYRVTHWKPLPKPYQPKGE